MLDTVILSIPRDKMRTLNDKRFPEWRLEKTKRGFALYVKNTTKEETDRGLSYIKLNGYTRSNGKNGYIKTVNIEFSANKLIKENNNLNEMVESEADLVLSTLQSRLRDMGEIVALKDLNAEISAFHPAKNVVLSDGYTASSVIKELSKINVSKKFDKTDMVFANDGESLQIRTECHSIVFYDKISDMAKDSKKAIDKDQGQYQQDLFTEIRKKMPTLEVLRLEVRLSTKRKMKEVMKKLGFTDKPIFSDIFKKDVCQKIVRWYWEEIIKGENLFLFELLNSPKRLLRKVIKEDNGIKAKQSIFLVGLSVLSKDEGGIRELRQILSKRTKQRNWYRFSDDIKQLNKIANKRSLHSWVQQIDQAVESFEVVKLDIKKAT
jgi:AraC-like DNA-binding protein